MPTEPNNEKKMMIDQQVLRLRVGLGISYVHQKGLTGMIKVL